MRDPVEGMPGEVLALDSCADETTWRPWSQAMTPWARFRADCVVVVSNDSFRSGGSSAPSIVRQPNAAPSR
jgi:hypothetical protein